MSKLVVFIHGIGSDNEAWNDFKKVLKGNELSIDIIDYEPNITKVTNEDEVYCYYYTYKSKIMNIPVSGKFLDDCKTKFSGKKDEGKITIENHVQSFKSFLSLNQKQFSEINIVAHSMGGILTVKLLFALIKKKDNLYKKINNVLLYGSPLNGSKEPEEIEKFSSKNIPTNVLNELRPESITITTLKQSIEVYNSKLKELFNITYISGDEDSRIEKVKEKEVIKFGNFEQISGGHSDIIRPQNIQSSSYILFLGILNKKTNEENLEDTTSIQENDKLFKDYIDKTYEKSSKISTIVCSQIKINLDLIYEEINLIEINSNLSDKEENIQLDYCSNSCYYFIIDEAGMGKSTFSKYLVTKIIKETNRIPILFELSEYDISYSLNENLFRQFDNIHKSLERQILEELIVQGKFFIILDGYDELSYEYQNKLKSEI